MVFSALQMFRVESQDQDQAMEPSHYKACNRSDSEGFSLRCMIKGMNDEMIS